jgi:hypothetical protein
VLTFTLFVRPMPAEAAPAAALFSLLVSSQALAVEARFSMADALQVHGGAVALTGVTVEEWTTPPGANRTAGLARVLYTIAFPPDHAANQVAARPTPTSAGSDSSSSAAGGSNAAAGGGSDAPQARLLAGDVAAQYVNIGFALTVPSLSVDGDDPGGSAVVSRQNASLQQLQAAVVSAFPASSLLLPPAAQGFASAAVDALVTSGMSGTTNLFAHGVVVTSAALPSMRPISQRPADPPVDAGPTTNRVAVIGAVGGSFLAITAVVVVAVALRRMVVKAHKRRGMTSTAGGRDGRGSGGLSGDSVRNPIRTGLAHAVAAASLGAPGAAGALEGVDALPGRFRKSHRPWLAAFVGGGNGGGNGAPGLPGSVPHGLGDADDDDDDGTGLRPRPLRGGRSGMVGVGAVPGKWQPHRRPVHASDVLLSVQAATRDHTAHAHPDSKRLMWEATMTGQSAAGTGLTAVNATNCIALAAIGHQAPSAEGDWWDSGGEDGGEAGEHADGGGGDGGGGGGSAEPCSSADGDSAAPGESAEEGSATEDEGSASNPQGHDVTAAVGGAAHAAAAASRTASGKVSRATTPSAEPVHVHAPPSVLFRPHALRALPAPSRGKGVLSPGTGYAAATAAYAHRNMDAMMGDSDEAESDAAPQAPAPAPARSAAPPARAAPAAAAVHPRHANIPLYEPRNPATGAAHTPSVTATLAAALATRGAQANIAIGGIVSRRGRGHGEDGDAAAGSALAAGTRVYNPLTVGRHGAAGTGLASASGGASGGIAGDVGRVGRQHSGLGGGGGGGHSASGSALHLGGFAVSRGRSAASQPPSRETSDGVPASRIARAHSNVSVGSTASAFHSPSPRSRMSSEHAMSTTALTLPPPALLRQSTADKLVLRVPDGGSRHLRDSSDDDDEAPLPVLPAARRSVQSMAVARSGSLQLAPGTLPSWGSAGSVMHASGPSLVAGGPSAYSRALMAAAGGSTDSLPSVAGSGGGGGGGSRKPSKPTAPHPDRHAPGRQGSSGSVSTARSSTAVAATTLAAPSGAGTGVPHVGSATALSALGVSGSGPSFATATGGAPGGVAATAAAGTAALLTAGETAALEAASQRFHTYRHPSISSECERTSKHGHGPRGGVGGAATTGMGR